MKTTLLFLLFTITVNSQWNYILEGNKITWQKIFTTNGDDDYKLHFKENALTTNLDFLRNKTAAFSDNFILENISKTKTFFEGFNIEGGIIAHVTLEFKEDKYRVTIKEMKTISKYGSPGGDHTYNSRNNNYLSVESFMYEDNRLKKEPIYKEIMMALHHHFEDAFTLD